MKRNTITITLLIACLLLFAFGLSAKAQKTEPKAKTPTAPLQLAKDMLRMANRIEASQMREADRNKLADEIEAMAAYIQKEYNTGVLCHTDAECQKLAE